MTINLRSQNQKRRKHDLDKYSGKYRVIADGIERPECFYYDGRRRILGMHKLNSEGKPYLDPDRQWEVAVEFKKFRRIRLVKK